MKCVVCQNTEWLPLPIPAPGRSLTTAGIILPEPLEKEQCASCGLLQKKAQRFLGNETFYEERYQKYYERPKSEHFDRGRYEGMAQWMQAALDEGFVPRSIIDVGCGAGRSMAVMQGVYPDAAISGIEPSIVNADRARADGFKVSTQRFGRGDVAAQYDLIYATNVLQHVTDLSGFFRDLAASLTADGRAAMILPDASVASSEMLWCDHNYSFRPKDLFALAEKAGLQVCNWQSNPPNNALLDKQIVVMNLANGSGMSVNDLASPLSNAALFEQRSLYMSKWQQLDRELTRRTGSYKRVFNFGASMWTWLLAAYCPDYWATVTACLVDGGSGECMDKPVVSPDDAHMAAGDCIALGVNPENQAFFQTKLSGLGVDVIVWADQISN